MVPNCAHLLTDIRTVFVFVLGPFLPIKVIFFDFNGNFNGKMAKNQFLAIKWLGVNHYRYNHYQWPSLPYDTHYQWQSLPHDSHYHWQPLPATTTRFYLARKPLPATTTTWQQLPYDDHHHITKTTTFPLTICCLQMYENSKYLILG